MDKMYRVQGFDCPTIVIVETEDGDTQRCNAAVYLRAGYEPPTWHAYVFVECMEGHDLGAMAKGLPLDLDGVPIGA